MKQLFQVFSHPHPAFSHDPGGGILHCIGHSYGLMYLAQIDHIDIRRDVIWETLIL